jgi:hypothetical protein
LIEIVPPTNYRDDHEKEEFEHVTFKHMISFTMQVSYLHAKASFRFGSLFLMYRPGPVAVARREAAPFPLSLHTPQRLIS